DLLLAGGRQKPQPRLSGQGRRHSLRANRLSNHQRDHRARRLRAGHPLRRRQRIAPALQLLGCQSRRERSGRKIEAVGAGLRTRPHREVLYILGTPPVSKGEPLGRVGTAAESDRGTGWPILISQAKQDHATFALLLPPSSAIRPAFEVGCRRADGVKSCRSQNNKQRRLRMSNEDNTQHLSNSNSQVIAAIRALEDRVVNVEGVIVARLNDTRPLERQILARIDKLATSVDELAATVNELRIGQNATLEKIATIQEDQATMRADYDRFRQETDQNFRMMIKRQNLLNNDNLG